MEKYRGNGVRYEPTLSMRVLQRRLVRGSLVLHHRFPEQPGDVGELAVGPDDWSSSPASGSPDRPSGHDQINKVIISHFSDSSHLDNCNIERVNSFKSLGIHFDSKVEMATGEERGCGTGAQNSGATFLYTGRMPMCDMWEKHMEGHLSPPTVLYTIWTGRLGGNTA